jgi:hypothetical protein
MQQLASRKQTCSICQSAISGGMMKRHLLIHERGRKRAPKGQGSSNLPRQCGYCLAIINHGNLSAHIKRNHKPVDTTSKSNVHHKPVERHDAMKVAPKTNYRGKKGVSLTQPLHDNLPRIVNCHLNRLFRQRPDLFSMFETV